MKSYILWDHDGVLVDTEPWYFEATRRHVQHLGVTLAIVTTARREDFELIHRERRIGQHMEFVLASGDYPRAKPMLDPYLAARTGLQCRHLADRLSG